MNNLIEFDAILSDNSINPDAWFDYMEEVAASKTAKFSDEEWNSLGDLWPSKKEEWQIKLAGILGSFNLPKSIPILEKMILEASTKVAIEAINSLEGMDGAEYLYIPSAMVMRQLEQILVNDQNPIHKQNIESILNRQKS